MGVAEEAAAVATGVAVVVVASNTVAIAVVAAVAIVVVVAAVVAIEVAVAVAIETVVVVAVVVAAAATVAATVAAIELVAPDSESTVADASARLGRPPPWLPPIELSQSIGLSVAQPAIAVGVPTVRASFAVDTWPVEYGANATS